MTVLAEDVSGLEKKVREADLKNDLAEKTEKWMERVNEIEEEKRCCQVHMWKKMAKKLRKGGGARLG